MLKPVRRIVTGHDAQGRSVVASDAAAEAVFTSPAAPDRGWSDLWVTDRMPASNAGAPQPPETALPLEPPPNGTVIRFVQIPPEGAEAPGSDREREESRAAATFDAMGAAHARVDTSRHPAMHKTATVDYIILLSGRVTMLLDEGEVDLAPGDVVIQRGTNHAWVNKGEEPAVFAAILIDAEPV